MAKTNLLKELQELAKARDGKTSSQPDSVGNPVAVAKAIVAVAKEKGTLDLLRAMYSKVNVFNGTQAGYDKNLLRANWKRPIFWCINSVPACEMTNKGEVGALLSKHDTTIDQLLNCDEAMELLGCKKS
jgi:hypothetical protein